ncbi:MAG: TenA family transcriptional regulator [Bacteroidota bacterium]
MKNNRQVHLDQAFITQHQLSHAEPAPDALFWKLWNANVATAKQALETKFVQGIKSGKLDPTVYGAFNISDAYYCFHGAEDYQTAASRALNPTLKAYLLKKYNSYKSYNDTFPQTWRIKDGSSIVPTKACAEYAAYESTIVSTEAPIYCIILMLPCEYLWAWLGAQLSPPTANNLYTSWITGNNDPSGAYTMGNFIEEYQASNPIDEAKAMEIYSKAMRFELENFISAFDQ